jgi:hypothetical protein
MARIGGLEGHRKEPGLPRSCKAVSRTRAITLRTNHAGQLRHQPDWSSTALGSKAGMIDLIGELALAVAAS